MITSKLTTNAQTTVPEPIRKALSLNPGDQISYSIEGDAVVMRKAGPRISAADDPFASFDEWDSEADRRAYRG